MNREETLKYFRGNSRLANKVLLNPISEEDKGGWYEEVWIEFRIGNNGSTFIIYDMGKHGFDMYYPDGKNELDHSIEYFNQKTLVK